MSFGFFSSESEATDNRAAADNAAQIATGKNNTITNPGAISVANSKGSKVLAPGSLDLAGATLTDSRNSGLQIGRDNTIGNITITGTDEKLLDKTFGTLQGYINAQNTANSEASAANDGLLTSLFDKLGKALGGKVETISASESDSLTGLDTGSDSGRWKWIIGVALLLGLAWLWRKRT